MNIYSYIYIILGILLNFLFGRIFIKKSFSSSLLAGILISASVLSVTARFIPLYTKNILYIFYLIGIIYFFKNIHNTKNYFFNIKFDIHKINLFLILIIFFFSLFSFFHFSNYSFESHDVLYFGPSFEMLKANYFGNLAVSVYYPFKMASNHLLAAAAAVSIGFLNLKPNLMFFIEIRYILIGLFLSFYFFRIYDFLNSKKEIFFLSILYIFTIYWYEYSNNFLLSSYIYVFTFLELLILSFEHKKNYDHNNKKYILFFSIMLIACKAPIFYIAFFMSFYLWLKLKSVRYNKIIIMAVILVFFNILTWIFVPKTVMLKNASKYGMYHSFDKYSNESFYEVSHRFQDELAKNITFKYLKLYKFKDIHFKWTLIVILYMFFKYYGIFLLLYNYIEISIYRKSLLIYMFSSLLGWIVIRNNNAATFQVHSFFLSSIVTSFIFFIILNKYPYFIIYSFPLFIFYFLNPDTFIIYRYFLFFILIYWLFSKMKWFQFSLTLFMIIVIVSGIKESLKYNDIKIIRLDKSIEKFDGSSEKNDIATIKSSNTGFYKPLKNEEFWKMELNSMLSGLRLKAENVKKLDHGEIRDWVLKK